MSELPFMSTSEAASLLSVHDETVRRWCEKGELRAQFERGVWFIDRKSVKAFQENMDKRQELIEQERKDRARTVYKCPRCGRKIRGPGPYASHRTACKRLFRQLEEESEPDEWRPDTDEYDPEWLRRLRREA